MASAEEQQQQETALSAVLDIPLLRAMVWEHVKPCYRDKMRQQVLEVREIMVARMRALPPAVHVSSFNAHTDMHILRRVTSDRTEVRADVHVVYDGPRTCRNACPCTSAPQHLPVHPCDAGVHLRVQLRNLPFDGFVSMLGTSPQPYVTLFELTVHEDAREAYANGVPDAIFAGASGAAFASALPNLEALYVPDLALRTPATLADLLECMPRLSALRLPLRDPTPLLAICVATTRPLRFNARTLELGDIPWLPPWAAGLTLANRTQISYDRVRRLSADGAIVDPHCPPPKTVAENVYRIANLRCPELEVELVGARQREALALVGPRLRGTFVLLTWTMALEDDLLRALKRLRKHAPHLRAVRVVHKPYQPVDVSFVRPLMRAWWPEVQVQVQAKPAMDDLFP